MVWAIALRGVTDGSERERVAVQGKRHRLLPQADGFEGVRTIQVDVNGRQATVPNSPDMGRFPLGRYAARTTLGEDADKHRHSTAGVDEAFRFKPKFCPRLAKHADELSEALSAPKHLLALGVVGRHPNLQLLLEVVAEQAIKDRPLIVGANR